MIYCLSIRQPHIEHILDGQKPIEYRQWKAAPKLRGWIALHASLTVEWECVHQDDLDYEFLIGGILGIAAITDARLMGCKDVHIHLSQPHWLPKPIRYKGKLGFFPVEGKELANLKRQMKQLGIAP